MSEKLILTPELVRELETLFSYCPPSSLRRTIEHFYFSYTIDEANLYLLPSDFHEKSTDIYLLLDFLNKVELQE